jgi:hypothetical protein
MNNAFAALMHNKDAKLVPEQIIYAKCDFGLDATGKRIAFQYSDLRAYPRVDIDVFVTSLLKNGAPPAVIDKLFMAAADPILRTPFDLNVNRPSYVVFELESSHNWQFQKGGAGLSNKGSIKYDNCDLVHAWAEGTGANMQVYFRADAVPVDNCRVVYFSVLRRAAHEGQPVNLHLEFIQDAGANEKRLILIADPDIKNDGSQPYPP